MHALMALVVLFSPVGPDQGVREGPRPEWRTGARVRARCVYRCWCHYVERRMIPCQRHLRLWCPGRACGPCMDRARARARRSCGKRGTVRRCTCRTQKIFSNRSGGSSS